MKGKGAGGGRPRREARFGMQIIKIINKMGYKHKNITIKSQKRKKETKTTKSSEIIQGNDL